MTLFNKLLLPLALLLSIAGVLVLTSSFNKSTTQFYGLTDDHEQTVSFEEPTEITEIKVIEGQYVEQGDVLLRAKRSELDERQIQLETQIDELNARSGQSTATINAEIRVLSAKKKAELAKVDMQIQQLASKQQRNVDLYRNITGSAPNAATLSENSPIAEQTRMLQQQKRFIVSSLDAQISALRTQLRAGRKPISVQKKQVKNRLNELKRQAQELVIHADFTGRIGSINVKPGERVQSFKGLMTVHALYPEYVKGYIHENVSNDAKVGQQVWIHTSNKHKQLPVPGVIESLGSRIVEYPERLKMNPQIRAWGREVNIRLDSNNPLLLGEKVQISFSPQRPNSAQAFFNPFSRKAEELFPDTFAIVK